ncbi:MAG TPA: nickel-binding protein [Solirubrobacterales bacterium]
MYGNQLSPPEGRRCLYVVKDEDGTLGSVCIYQATDIETVGEHAEGVGMPADEVTEIADTVIVRPDPEAQPAA